MFNSYPLEPEVLQHTHSLVIGFQIIQFVIYSINNFLFWFIYFTIIGVPVFYFMLPLYLFWHMDDFSRGKTRKIAAMKQSFKKPQQLVEEDNDKSTKSKDESEGGAAVSITIFVNCEIFCTCSQGILRWPTWSLAASWPGHNAHRGVQSKGGMTNPEGADGNPGKKPKVEK